jgi:hypothetical protein
MFKVVESTSLKPEQLAMFVSATTRKERLAKCNACEHIKQLPITKYRQCGLCNCVVEVKTAIKRARCPESKWVESTSDYQQEPA